MYKLSLFFTKNGIHFQVLNGKNILEEEMYYLSEDSPSNLIEDKLDEILSKYTYEKIDAISALNHFAIAPESFPQDESGYDLVGFNSDFDKDQEELMLSVNQKHQVQFFYTFPKHFYHKIKAINIPAYFNFSGEKFLNSINNKNQREIHIHLLKNQVEFIVFDNKKIILYNNLDATSEVDYLYFIMFTIKKLDFDKNEVKFHLYGDIEEHETFISELRKFVKHLSIDFENKSKKHFIFN